MQAESQEIMWINKFNTGKISGEILIGFVSVSFIKDSKIPKTVVFKVRQVDLPASPTTLICWNTVLAAADLMTLFLLGSHLIRTIP